MHINICADGCRNINYINESFSDKEATWLAYSAIHQQDKIRAGNSFALLTDKLPVAAVILL